MVKLRDIAQAAGCSVSTASRALADSPAISEDTKQRVMAAADELGYRQRGKAGKLTVNWNTAGVIAPEVSSDYYAKIVHLAQERFAQQNYNTLIEITNFDQDAIIRAIRQVGKYRIKCLLIIIDDAQEQPDELLDTVRETGVPVVFITAKYFPNMDFDCIYIDEGRGTAMAVEHLCERGYKRIGYIGEMRTLIRQKNFLESLRACSLPVYPELVRTGRERGERGGYLRMKEILAAGERPDALFASYDQMAVGAILAINEAGLRIPEDIAVIGFDDITVSGYIAGGLTTISNPYEDMVSIATRILMKRVSSPYVAPQQIALRPNLVVRKTT